jgi:hypothetical protein
MSDRYIHNPNPETVFRRIKNRFNRLRHPSDKSESTIGLNEHLSKGNKPIYACVAEVGKGGLPLEIAERMLRRQAQGRAGVQYEDESIETLDMSTKDQEGRLAFVAPNSSDKVSTEFRNCVGIVVVGKRKANEKQISFVFHASPDEFVFSNPAQQAKVREAVQERLEYMQQKCKSGSIDAVLVGGNDPSKDIAMLGVANNDYRTMVEAYGEIVKEVLHFDPVVVAPPLQGQGDTHVYFETTTRRLFVYKDSDFPKYPHAFRAADVSAEEDAWRKKS